MLDTNVASAIIRGTRGTLRARLQETPVSATCISTITEGELLYGLARKPGATALQAAVETFLRQIEVVAWDRVVAMTYGRLRADLEARGTPLGNLDTLIAAHALATGRILVTNDKAFARVPDLPVENWLSA